jgi:hypothetical protein
MRTEQPTLQIPQRELVPVSTDRMIRPHVRGKFLYTEDEKFYVCGVTYGTSCPGADGCEYDPPYPTVERLLRDTQLAANFTYRRAGFGLAQDGDHLFFRERLSGHG